MKSDILSPKALFQKNVRYIIPTFQRPYVWRQESQWEPLWEDVRNSAERYLEELDNFGEDRRAEAENATASHFLGALVLQQQPTATIDIEQRLVIDGQQRLTTLQLLLDAAQQVCEDLELGPESRRLSKLVLNDEDFVESSSDQIFKVWPTLVDREAFRQTMRNSLDVTGFEDSSIVQAHEFFQDQIREWLTEPEDPSRRAAALETALTGLLQMVVIDLEFHDDSHVIFETLNARGTRLRESDLIKNFVLYSAREKGIDEEGLYTDHWKGLEDRWWQADVRQGRLVRPRVDVYLNYWLSMRTATDIQASGVFDSFRRYAASENIEAVAADISKLSGSYRGMDSVEEPDEAAFIYRWRIMEAGVVTPILLLLFSAEPENLSPERRKRGLKAIESFLVRRMACRLGTKDYSRMFLDLAAALQQNHLESSDEVIMDFLGGQTSESREWPDDSKMQEAFLNLPLFRLLTRGRLRIILEGLEQTLRTSMAEQQSVPLNLTIEHLMPRAWREHWPLPDNVIDYEKARLERNRLVHTIGNLTLVNDRLNPHLSNGAWTRKRESLAQHSVLFLNKDILSDPLSISWNEDAIRRRGHKLAELACAMWPGPSDSAWE